MDVCSPVRILCHRLWCATWTRGVAYFRNQERRAWLAPRRGAAEGTESKHERNHKAVQVRFGSLMMVNYTIKTLPRRAFGKRPHSLDLWTCGITQGATEPCYSSRYCKKGNPALMWMSGCAPPVVFFLFSRLHRNQRRERWHTPRLSIGPRLSAPCNKKKEDCAIRKKRPRRTFGKRPPEPRSQKENQAFHSSERTVEDQSDPRAKIPGFAHPSAEKKLFSR